MAKFVKDELAEEQVDVLLQNAGVMFQKATPREAAHPTLDTNLRGLLRLSRAAEPNLAPDARVIVVTSGLGELTDAYSAERRRAIRAADTEQGLNLILFCCFCFCFCLFGLVCFCIVCL